jgi:hypothetical protein
MEFIRRLKTSVFENLSTENHTVDLHGWIDPNFKEFFIKKVCDRDRQKALTVIEVGSWKGLSCVTMAEVLKELGFTNFNIICVDTWLGAPEFWTWGIDDTSRGESLKCVNGYPTVFYTFSKNIKTLGHDDVVAPLPLSSQQALEVVKYYKIEADIIYIDASHEYDAVKSDIYSWSSILKESGLMFGDDYSTAWPGVIKAIDEYGTPTINGVLWSFP